MIFYLLVIFLCALYLLIERKKKIFSKICERYQTTLYYDLPFIGHSYVFLGTNDEERMGIAGRITQDTYKTDGLSVFWLGAKCFFVIANPLVAATLLKTCLEKDDVFNCWKTLFGNGSLFAPVPVWRPRRKCMAPLFSMKNLNQFVNVFDEQSRVLVSRMADLKNEQFSISDYLIRYSMDALCENTLGIKLRAQLGPDQPFLHSVNKALELQADRLVRPWLHNDTIYKLAHRYDYKTLCHHCDIVLDFVAKVVKSKKNSMHSMQESGNNAESTNNNKTFLEHIIASSKNHESFGITEMTEETLVLLIGGIDTTAVAVSFATVLLSRHPDVQEKCYKELQDIFGESNRAVNAGDLPAMKYIEATIKETMRLYPPVPFIIRQTHESIVLPTGDYLPSGCHSIINIFGIHRNPSCWGADAEEFRPERFLNSELKHPAAFIPFSYGPRGCTGYQYAMMSMKTVVATILRHYRLLPARQTKTFRLKHDLMLRDVDNFQLKIETRQK